MKHRVIRFLETIIQKTMCFFKGHAWLTPLHGKRVCNCCGKRQERSPVTQYRWIDVECVIKPFNPFK